MKKLNKIKLGEFVNLNNNEMKVVMGGSGGLTSIHCYCTNGEDINGVPASSGFMGSHNGSPNSVMSSMDEASRMCGGSNFYCVEM